MIKPKTQVYFMNCKELMIINVMHCSNIKYECNFESIFELILSVFLLVEQLQTYVNTPKQENHVKSIV